MTKVETKGKIKMNKGRFNFAALLLLTILEFVVATQFAGSLIFLWIIMLAKAGLIIEYFMHISKLKKINSEGNH